MPKRPNPTTYLEECIETAWKAQREMLDDTCDEYKALTAKVEAYQDVYAFINDGAEYGGGSGVLDDDRPGLDEDEEEKKPLADEEEDDETEDTDETDKD